jgi:hypothetical protein
MIKFFKKKNLSIFLFFFSFSFLQAQDLSFGLKGGIESNFLAKTNLFSKESSPIKIGWQAGAFAIIDFPFFFLQPEITYSFLNSTYTIFKNKELTHQNNRLNLGVFIGKTFLEYFRIFIGPLFYLNLKENLYLNKPNFYNSKNKINMAFELAIGVKYLFFLLDFKYQKAFFYNQNAFSYNHQTYSLTPKSNILTLSIGVIF